MTKEGSISPLAMKQLLNQLSTYFDPLGRKEQAVQQSDTHISGFTWVSIFGSLQLQYFICLYK